MPFYLSGGLFLTEGGAFAISENCCCSAEQPVLSADVWRKCPDDSFAAFINPGVITDDYAWLCLGSEWVRSYLDTTILSGEVTEPDYIEQCFFTPTQCSELSGIYATDDYALSGNGCQSVDYFYEGPGVTQGKFFKLRYEDNGATLPEDGTALVDPDGAGFFVLSGSVDNSKPVFNSKVPPMSDGKWEMLNITVDDDAGWHNFQWIIDVGGSTGSFRVGTRGATWTGKQVAWNFTPQATVTGPVSLRAYWDGSNWLAQYDVGSGWVTAATLGSGTLRPNGLGNWKQNTRSGQTVSTDALEIKIDKMVFENGLSGNIIIDPTGEPC